MVTLIICVVTLVIHLYLVTKTLRQDIIDVEDRLVEHLDDIKIMLEDHPYNHTKTKSLASIIRQKKKNQS